MGDVLLPSNDRAVLLQLVATVVVAAVVMAIVRKERALVELVAGLALVTVGLMGVRALH